MIAVFVITQWLISLFRVGQLIQIRLPSLNVGFCIGEGTEPPPTGIGILRAIIRLFSMDAMRELGKIPGFASAVSLSLIPMTALLYLHRIYLVEALSRWPEDPVHSRFGLSVVAVHRSSLIILQGFHRIREHFTALPPSIISFWLQVSFAPCSTALCSTDPCLFLNQGIGAYVSHSFFSGLTNNRSQ
jgi:hypothetical protein